MASRPKQSYTSAEMAKLILADNDDNSGNFSWSSNSSYRDSDESFEQSALPPSDSDEPCSNVSSSEAESDEDSNLDAFFNAAYYAAKKLAVKWRKYSSSGAGTPKARDITQELGSENYVPTSIAHPKDAFDLTFLIELVQKVLEFSNQCYQHFCQQYPQSSAADRLHGYHPFTINEILVFIGLQFILRANQMGPHPLPDLFTSLQLPLFRAAISRDRLKLIFRICRFDDSLIREKRNVQHKICHIHKVWDKLIFEATKLYNPDPSGTIDEMLLKFRGQCITPA